MAIQTREQLGRFYRQHLETAILPFWLAHGIDDECGGFFTCFDNSGDRLASTDKYTWSQGRFVWLWSRLSAMASRGLIAQDPAMLLQLAASGFAFLDRHVFLENGNCAYVLERDGTPKESIPGQGYDTSFYADCFVIIGFAEYARVGRDPRPLERALSLYDRVTERFATSTPRSEPYPIPDDYAAHSVPMIMLNVSQELANALEAFDHPRGAAIRSRATEYLREIMERFRQEDDRIAEILPLRGQSTETILCRHVTPGHALESMWFVMTEAERAGRRDWIEAAARVIKRAFALGWDADYGGLLRYVDRNGGMPRGERVGGAYERLVADTWDTKIWWPHSEALYAPLLAHALTGDDDLLALHARIHDYVFATFPNPNADVGEWIQIRDREGRPMDKVVALPVKDPFHIMRNLLLLVELLNGPRGFCGAG